MSQFLPILQSAMAAEIGVKVHTNDPGRLRSALQALRSSLVPDFDCLSFRIPHDAPTELWVIKNARKTNDEGQHPPL